MDTLSCAVLVSLKWLIAQSTVFTGIRKVVVDSARKSCHVDTEIVEQIKTASERAVAADDDKVVDIPFS